jgi:prophage regulatory protein
LSNQAPAKPEKFLRLRAVEEATSLKKTTIYAGLKARTFPAPVRLTARAVAWRESDIAAWQAGRKETGGGV